MNAQRRAEKQSKMEKVDAIVFWNRHAGEKETMRQDRDLPTQVKKRVLVAEREPIVRYGLSHLTNLQPDLEICGEQENSDRLLHKIVSTQANLLIIDLFLISTGIFQLLETILTHSPKLGILVLSRYDEFLYAQRVLKLGAKGYLRKEASTDQMLAAMRHVLRGDLFVSQRLNDILVDSLVGATPKAHLDSLTDRELEIFHLLGQGYSTVEIATTLHRSVKTIDTHRKNIKQKLKAPTTAKLIQQAVQWNIHCFSGVKLLETHTLFPSM